MFYKESLPLKIRHDDLSFGECIVTELLFGRKKIFFTVLYRNPNKVDTPEFENFVQEFEDLYQKIKDENPYTIIFTGDFKALCIGGPMR